MESKIDFRFGQFPDRALDLDSAKLKLAIMKKNFEYQEFFKKFDSDPCSLWPLLSKFEGGSKDEQLKRMLKSLQEPGPHFGTYCKKFGIRDDILAMALAFVPLSEILTLLDPNKDIPEVSSAILINQVLPKMFLDPGIKQIINVGPIQPYEGIFIADFRKRKSQLIDEFDQFIEDRQKYRSGWSPDRNRERQEGWEYLKVWEMRKRRKSFQAISRHLGITQDLAKKRFYRAYELTQGRVYDPERYRREGQVITKNDISKYCGNCPDRETCSVLCPDVLAYVEQDQVTLQEKLLEKDAAPSWNKLGGK